MKRWGVDGLLFDVRRSDTGFRIAVASGLWLCHGV